MIALRKYVNNYANSHICVNVIDLYVYDWTKDGQPWYSIHQRWLDYNATLRYI